MADSEPAKQPTHRPAIAAGLLGMGILLLVLSFFWPGQSISRTAWSPEQAKAYQAASVKLHTLSQQTVTTAGSNSDKVNREKLAEAETEYKAIRTQLDSAIDRPKHLTYALRIVGALLAITGLTRIYRRSGKE